MKNHKMGIFPVAIMYVGTIMGAGFASGREIWQFFGVFEEHAYTGIALVGTLFVIVGVMTSIIARKLHTNDMGRVIVPSNHRGVENFVGYFMAVILFTVLITMSSAGGALFNQQFGLSRILGGAVIIFLVIITVIGGFNRVSKVFHYIMPVLMTVVIGVCILVIFKDLPQHQVTVELNPSPLAPTWALSAILYLSYNMLAIVPIVATASINAKSTKHAVLGTALGGILLGILAFLIVTAMKTDQNFSQIMDMPMLGFSEKLSPVINGIYITVLFFAIYASATSNYYGFTTKLKTSPRKNMLIIIIGVIGFLFGLMGFKNVVAYMFPIEGFIGIAIIIMVIINFVKVMRMKKMGLFNNLLGSHDRFDFPEGIKRVTAGHGGESILVFGSEKTALMDCGMAYCGSQLVENIKRELNGKTLDYVILSHTHYDHIGALPYVKEAFPRVVIYGSKKGQRILERPGAIRLIKELGETARADYAEDNTREILTKDLEINVAVENGREISLGREHFLVLETKGHTDCSLSYVLEPQGIMFASESTGILEREDFVHTAILKSYDDAMTSLRICQNYNPKYIICPHYGILPEDFNDRFWQLFVKAAEEKLEFVRKLNEKGLSLDEMLIAYKEEYWQEEKEEEQPLKAFMINGKNMIKVLLEKIE
ncbi:MAG: MBL fold metallo-hydrolase [Anaerovoracaceae bacterium]